MARTYLFFGENLVVVKLLNTFLSVLTALLGYRVMRNLGMPGPRWALVLLLFFPSIAFWTALTLKDSFVIFFLISSLWAASEFIRTRNYIWVPIAVLLLVPLETVRLYMLVTGALALLGVPFAMPTWRHRTLSTVAIVPTTYVLLAVVQPFSDFGPNIFYIPIQVRADAAQGARTSFVDPRPVIQGEPGDRFQIAIVATIAPDRSADPKLATPEATGRIFHVLPGTPIVVQTPGPTLAAAAPTPTPAPPTLAPTPTTPALRPTPVPTSTPLLTPAATTAPTPTRALPTPTPTPVVVRPGDIIVIVTPTPAVAAAATPSPSLPPLTPTTQVPATATPSPRVVVLEPQAKNTVGLAGEVPSEAASFQGSVNTNIRHLPIGMLFTLFAPFPWTARTVEQFATIPEMVLWYACMALALTGFVYLLRRRDLRYAHGVMAIVGLVMVLSLIGANVGTLIRSRAMLIPYVLLLAGVGFDWLVRRYPAIGARWSWLAPN